MALSLIQKSALKRNQNARDRVATALPIAGAEIDAEAFDPTGKNALQIETRAKNLALANILYEGALNWVDPTFSRIVNLPELNNIYLQLCSDSNMLSAEDSDAMDQTLVSMIVSVFPLLSRNLVVVTS